MCLAFNVSKMEELTMKKLSSINPRKMCLRHARQSVLAVTYEEDLPTKWDHYSETSTHDNDFSLSYFWWITITDNRQSLSNTVNMLSKNSSTQTCRQRTITVTCVCDKDQQSLNHFRPITDAEKENVPCRYGGRPNVTCINIKNDLNLQKESSSEWENKWSLVILFRQEQPLTFAREHEESVMIRRKNCIVTTCSNI